MSRLAAPVVVVIADTVCDTKWEHPARILTDGFRAVALDGVPGSPSQQGTYVVMTCTNLTSAGTCHGEHRVNLAASDAWQRPTQVDIDTLNTHGEDIER